VPTKNREMVILCHNIRDINSDGKHNSIRNKVLETRCDIVCLQETKRDHFDITYLKKICPTDFDCVSFTPSFGASGGTIIIWKGNKLHGEVILENEFAQAVQFMSKLNGENGF
jgi:exonuclease III